MIAVDLKNIKEIKLKDPDQIYDLSEELTYRWWAYFLAEFNSERYTNEMQDFIVLGKLYKYFAAKNVEKIKSLFDKYYRAIERVLTRQDFPKLYAQVDKWKPPTTRTGESDIQILKEFFVSVIVTAAATAAVEKEWKDYEQDGMEKFNDLWYPTLKILREQVCVDKTAHRI